MVNEPRLTKIQQQQKQTYKFQANNMQKTKKKQQIANNRRNFATRAHNHTFQYTPNVFVCLCIGLGFRMGKMRAASGSNGKGTHWLRENVAPARAGARKNIFLSTFILFQLFFLFLSHFVWLTILNLIARARTHTRTLIYTQTQFDRKHLPIQFNDNFSNKSYQYKHNTQFKYTFSITFSELNNNNSSNGQYQQHWSHSQNAHTRTRTKSVYLKSVSFVCFEKQRNTASSGRSSSNSSRHNNNNNDNRAPTTKNKTYI